MTMAVGKIVYQLGTYPITGCGLLYSEEELNDALNNRVKDIVFDKLGKLEVESHLMNLAQTEFETDAINKILSENNPPENWRVGEGIAECYLTFHRNCIFPWPDGRDERKKGSSLPGADLVGFRLTENDAFFAFGEVKTSSQNKFPPNVMTGRSGLEKQIEDLKDNDITKDNLLKYLAYRASGQSWKCHFEQAVKNFLRNKKMYVYSVS